MSTVDRPSGVRVTHPDEYRVTDPATPRRRARLMRGSFADPPRAASEVDLLADALSDQDIDVVDRVQVEPRPGARRARGRRPPLEVSVALKPEERAVVLVERDGVYEWKLPDRIERPAVARRGGPQTTRAPGRATFRIPLEAPPAKPPTRGLIGDIVTGRVIAVVMKFAAQVVVGKAISHLERNVRPGLVHVVGNDPAAWPRVESLSDIALPARRPARILLLVHGTFSSTVGGFGALAAHPHGQALLATAREAYDAIVGYDHRTLSEDPLVNASDLLERLRAAGTKHPPVIDVIAHSRGGLVTRSLTEHLLPVELNWRAEVRSETFVACTNGGTLFASPAHWKTFVDLYTNLAMAASRLVDLVAPPLVGTITRGAVQGVGAFVKYLVGAALDPDDVPGLAAMRPDGTFVLTINETQPGQPDPQSSRRYVVTSDFEPGSDGPRELPKRLLGFVGDAVVDQIFQQAANDLVVDVASMSAIDPHAGDFVDDRLDFGANASVHHCSYFLREEVVAAIGDWLELAPPADGESVVRGPHPPQSVDTDFIELGSDVPVADAQAALRRIAPRYVVITRPRTEGRYRYGFLHGELASRLSSAVTSLSLGAALELREIDSSDETDLTGAVVRTAPRGSARATSGEIRSVVVAGDEVAGVVTRSAPPPETADMLVRERAKRTRGGSPRGASPRGASPARRPADPAYVQADMQPDLEVDQVVPVHVQLSAEPLGQLSGRASAAGSVKPDKLRLDKPLTVQLMARTNLEVVDEDRADVPIPQAGDPPTELFFDVKGVAEGAGELWVVVRQGHPSLLLLKLKPTVRAGGVPASRVLQRAAGGVPAAAPIGWNVPTLRINERATSSEVVFEYELDLNEGGTHRFTSRPLTGDRDGFVKRIYADLEQRWTLNRADVIAFQRDIRGYGGMLWDELFPPELQRLLWRSRDKLRNIRVLSTEPFIPWELVHLKSPQTGRLPRETRFFGQMGLVRWLFDAPGAALGVRSRSGRVRFVIPDYPVSGYQLSEPAVERAFLEQSLGAAAVAPHPNPVFAMLSKRGAFDILHFAGHGVAAGGEVSDAKLLLEGYLANGSEDSYQEEHLLATTVRQEANLAKRTDPVRPLVFLNACQAGRLGRQLTSLGGFASAFIMAGAGAFVSSLWNVGDEPASTFGIAFYERLLAGDTIAEATVAARERARSAGDATWLAYVVYGHPDAKLEATPV